MFSYELIVNTLYNFVLCNECKYCVDLPGRELVRACASDSVVGGCEFKPRRCHLTGHMPDPLMPGLLMPP